MSIKRRCIDNDLHARRFQTTYYLYYSSWRVQHRAGTNLCHFPAGFPSNPPCGSWYCDLSSCSHVLSEAQNCAQCGVLQGCNYCRRSFISAAGAALHQEPIREVKRKRPLRGQTGPGSQVMLTGTQRSACPLGVPDRRPACPAQSGNLGHPHMRYAAGHHRCRPLYQ